MRDKNRTITSENSEALMLLRQRTLTPPLMRIILRKDALDFVYRRRQLDYLPPFQRCKSGARQMVTFGGAGITGSFLFIYSFASFFYFFSLYVFF